MRKLMITLGLLVVAATAPVGAPALAADDAHGHGQKAVTESSASGSDPHQHGASAPGQRDLLKDMQSMPAHDHQNCCTIKKQDQVK